MSEGGEKSFAPSAKRLQDAARKGDVLRSRELATAVAMLAGAAWLKFAGPWLFGELVAGMTTRLNLDRGDLIEFEPGRVMTGLLLTLIPPVLALAGSVLVLTLVSQLSFGEGRWLGSNLLPKASRLDPLAGLKRMFGANGWIELAKSIAKVALLGTIAWIWGKGHLGDLLGLGRGALGPQLSIAWDALTGLLFALSAGLVAIALIDFPVQFVRRWLRLKMSQQEVRDEHKESEGSPERKAAIRNKQRQLAMGGVRRAVQDAQFILTNPSHFAVAMAYDPVKAAAPIVLAKGRGDKALAMRELAAEFGIPVLEYPALARSVYFTTRENQVIREELYAAVAAALAFVFSLKRGEQLALPAIEVPVALRFDTEGRLTA